MREKFSIFVGIFMQFLRNIIGRPLVSGFVGILSVYGVYALYIKDTQSDLTQILPTQGTIQEVVEVTGRVTATQEASLAFQESGRVVFIAVNVGEKITTGQILARLQEGDIYSGSLVARANLEKAQADLVRLTAGPRKEEFDQKEQLFINAESSLSTFLSSLPDTLRATDAVLGDGIRTKLATVFLLNNGRYSIRFGTCDQIRSSKLEQLRMEFENNYATYQKDTSVITMLSDDASIKKAFVDAHSISTEGSALVDNVASFLSSECSIADTTLDGIRSTVGTVRTSLSAQLAELTTKRTTLINLVNAVTSAKLDLALLNAGSDSNIIQAQTAVVASLKAQLAQAEARSSKITLVAPFDGIVTTKNISLGGSASPNITALAVISSSGFQIEASVPEADIAKVSVGNFVNIKLDAHGPNTLFTGTVVRIDPTATFSGSVPMYNIVIAFREKSDLVRGGMTATVSIITKEVKNAVALPPSYVTIKADGSGVVTVVRGKATETRIVTTGVRGGSGLIEIVKGLANNETVQAQPIVYGGAQKNTTP